MNDDSLLNTEQQVSVTEDIDNNKVNDPNKISKKMMGVLAGIVLLSAIVFVFAYGSNTNGGAIPIVPPTKIVIALPQQTPFPILLGQSRVFEVFFYSGYDNRAADDYKSVTEREVIWTVTPQGIASIDAYGRLGTISAGTATVKVQSKYNTDIYAERTINVIANAANYEPLPKRVIDFNGEIASLNPVLQKIVTFYSKQDAITAKEVPESIKNVILDPQAERKNTVNQESGAVWSIMKYADKSNRTYIIRENTNEVDERDRAMHLIGNRYIAGDGIEVVSIQDDGENGLWTVNSQGVSHIAMKEFSYKAKAEAMLQNTQKNVMRHGLATSSYLSNGKWIGDINDNDGLWTSMFTAGEFMRYGALKDKLFPDIDIQSARDSALHSLKAVLLISNIAMRNITVDAKLRHYNNTRTGEGEKLSQSFLKQGKAFAVDTYAGSSTDGVGFFGVDAGKTIDGAHYGGKFKYSFNPIHKNDWTTNKSEAAATTKRILNGFIARTFVIESKEGIPPDGLFYKHNDNDTQTVIHEADTLYDYDADDHPVLNLGTMDLPQILKDFLIKQAGTYNKSDLYYKGDTSTDEVIGHLFLYKIAFDILDDNDPEEKTLKQLIQSTMVNFCTGLTNNDYTMVDATGQGTSWAKMTHTFMTSDSTIEDAPIKSLELLLSFKLCHYVTGDPRWKLEYEYLIEDGSFRYLDLVGAVWKRWTYRTYNQDYPMFNVYHLDANVTYADYEVVRHIMGAINYSDEEEAMLCFYLAFQLEDKEEYLAKYREGIQGWWHSISRSQNPLWYYIYQLAYPNQSKKDFNAKNLIDVASWQLSRQPIDTVRTTAFIQGSRNDVILEGNEKVCTLSVDPNRVAGVRLHKSDSKYAERAINYKVVQDYNPMNIYEMKVLPADERSIHKFNGATFEDIARGSLTEMEASTLFTLPYWMGVYHKMLPLQQ